MNRESLSLRYGAHLTLLDQTALPDVERWVEADDPGDMIAHIVSLRVRGAPLIGVAAALCVGRLARLGADRGELERVATRLRAARPTAVNLMWAMDRMKRVIEEGGDPEGEALAIFDEDAESCDRMADFGAALLGDGEGILTHCNTGGLATAGVGTALGVIRRAWEEGRRPQVWVDETRPLLQGARLTAWELRRLGIPHTLITDNAAGALLRSGRVQRVLVGADRVAANGDFANKVGTYGVAVLAAWHEVPFHVVAPWSTVDLACPDGATIPIEQRAADEVRGAAGSFGAVRWAPADVPVDNPAFDVTPAALVTSLVLDRGVVARAVLVAGGLVARRLATGMAAE